MASHNTSSQFTGGMAFTTLLNGHSITTDLAATGGGLDKGPRPKALMLLALSGCTGLDVVSILNKMRVSFTDFVIDINADLTDEEAATYKTVQLIYKIKVAEEDKPKVEKAVNLSLEKYCGVAAMFRKFATVTKEIVYL
ncbi:MAG: OsmC family protein [Chitinophagaceae bacterium]|nr:OsmC family protein [Chitinophagaceae bacterium]